MNGPILKFAALTVCTVLSAGPIIAYERPLQVDVALVLTADVSSSMAETDALLTQRAGFVAAFRNPAVVEAIRAGATGQVAVTYVEWADTAEQWIVVPWTVIGDGRAAEAFAERLEGAPTGVGYKTSLSFGLLFAAAQFATSGVAAMRQTIDVSGDGPSNAGPPIAAVRDFVVGKGITINGLPFPTQNDNDGPYEYLVTRPHIDMDAYFEHCVIGGPGAFVMPVSDPSQIFTAIRRKLVLEIAGLPARIIPASFAASSPSAYDAKACALPQ
jgi:hypothetical protein